MGRQRVIKKEPTTTLELYLADAMLIDEFQKRGETKPDAMRRICSQFFSIEEVGKKKREIRKKLDRQALLHGDDGDQATIDNVYYPRATIKDIVFNQKDLMNMVIEARQLTGELKMRHADDSIRKALTRGDIERADNGYKILNQSWLSARIVTR